MAIDALSGAAATTARSDAANTVAQQAEDAANTFAADFETFLKLLTTQLQFQDPLQPLESTQFVAQLAQFSTVEQQVATNKALGRILDAMGASGAGALGAWLGKEVRGANEIAHAGGPVEVFPVNVPRAAREVELTVRAVDGSIVRSIPFDAGQDSVIWDGADATGAPAPNGTYRFEARWKLDDVGEPQVSPAQVFGKVVEARRESDDSVTLVLEGGKLIAASDVTALRGG
jgi:flagellar basal-body rod modification protein FlgD